MATLMIVSLSGVTVERLSRSLMHGMAWYVRLVTLPGLNTPPEPG
jgi:hypothetical protein